MTVLPKKAQGSEVCASRDRSHLTDLELSATSMEFSDPPVSANVPGRDPYRVPGTYGYWLAMEFIRFARFAAKRHGLTSSLYNRFAFAFTCSRASRALPLPLPVPWLRTRVRKSGRSSSESDAELHELRLSSASARLKLFCAAAPAAGTLSALDPMTTFSMEANGARQPGHAALPACSTCTMHS